GRPSPVQNRDRSRGPHSPLLRCTGAGSGKTLRRRRGRGRGRGLQAGGCREEVTPGRRREARAGPWQRQKRERRPRAPSPAPCGPPARPGEEAHGEHAGAPGARARRVGGWRAPRTRGGSGGPRGALPTCQCRDQRPRLRLLSAERGRFPTSSGSLPDLWGRGLWAGHTAGAQQSRPPLPRPPHPWPCPPSPAPHLRGRPPARPFPALLTAGKPGRGRKRRLVGRSRDSGRIMDLSQLCALLALLAMARAGASDPAGTSPPAGLEIYKKLFAVKRKDQMKALKNLIELNDIHQQYKIIDVMLKGLFKVLEDSRTTLVASDIFPDGPFPEDEKLKDAFSHVVENTAFFGDVALRFPKIVHHYFDRNSNWNHLIRWGISFCNQTGIFDQGTYSQLLSLMAQELGIGERSPDYRNPFTTDHSETFSATDTFQKALKDEERRRKKEEKRKEIRKGPRISRSQTEL
uniref:Coiled-coil domain containing 134 n=1 Tax=Sarcophilus harrisii TaxID=9305 RepID=A0A7N4PEV5_SARHA